jgi:short-subunit dehydrogenase
VNPREDALGGNALIVGNSDGIGLEVTRRLLNGGWGVTGISRSESPVEHSSYTHYVADVTRDEFVPILRERLNSGAPDLFIYSAGIGEPCDPKNMEHESRVVDVNLMGMIRAVSRVVPAMVELGRGHIIGISSLADELLSAEAPSYHASKAGFSSYLESLALALEKYGVHVTNIRFGFVDTKMAKGDIKPFMMSVEKAADHVERCIERKPAVHTAPKIAVPLVKFRKWILRSILCRRPGRR